MIQVFVHGVENNSNFEKDMYVYFELGKKCESKDESEIEPQNVR